MRTTFWIVMAVLVGLVCMGTAYFVSGIRSDIRGDGRFHALEDAGPPSTVHHSGKDLLSRMDEALKLVNAQRASDRNARDRSAILMAPVRYERGGGAVRADGSFIDARPGVDDRRVSVVLDGYDEDRAYVASASAPVSPAAMTSTSFSVAMADSIAYESFSMRILDAQGHEIAFLTPDQLREKEKSTDGRGVLLLDDMLVPSDWPEAVERLKRLGYMRDEVSQPSGDEMRVSFERFRKDHGLPRAGLVDVGTLLALRIETPGFTPSTSATFP